MRPRADWPLLIAYQIFKTSVVQDYSFRLDTNSPLKGLEDARAETFSENQLYLDSLTLLVLPNTGGGNAY